MTPELEALERVRSANPVPDEEHLGGSDLTSLFAAVEQRRSTMSTGMRERNRSEERPIRRRLVPVVIFAAAMVLVIVGIGLVPALLSSNEEIAPAEDPPATTVQPSTTTQELAPTPSTVTSTPEATVPPTTSTTDEDRPEEVSGLSFEWTRIRLPGIPFDPADPFDGMKELTVAVFDGGLVVAGGNQIWMSPDGENWTETSTVSGHVRDIHAGGPGLVAVTAGWAAGSGPPRIWTSTDGVTWTLADLDGSYGSEDGPAGSTLRAVAGRGADLVAVGHDFIATSNDDGVTWTGTSLKRHPELGINVWMHDVTVGGPGFVAVGGSEDGWSAAWTSRDGTTWSRQSFGPTSGSWTQIEMKAVTTGGPGFVAVGHGTPPGIDAPDFADGRGAWVWTSPDGFTWTRAPHNAEAFENSTMNDVTAYGDTLVAVGGIEGTGEEGAVMWTSADGITWQRLPHDDLFDWWAMSSVVSYGDRLIAVGGDSVWTATPQSSGESTP